MPAAPSIRLVVRDFNDRELRAHILRMSRATGRTVKEETRTVFKGIIRDAIRYTPPSSSQAGGTRAKAQGEGAIARDLRRMGFAPKDLKGYRMVTMAFGHPIEPVRVKTKENPKFADPDTFHLARLQSKHGGKVGRGGNQAFYVSKRKFTAMVIRLRKEIGRLAKGWAKAAHQLGVPVPAWIENATGEGRGSEVQILETDNKISMRVVNYFPGDAPADEMIRRIRILKDYAIGRLKRQLPVLLRKNLR